MLVNILQSRKVIVLFVVALIMIIYGLILKSKIEKEVNFTKKINKRFWFKYVIFFMLIMGMMFVIASYILAFIFKEIGIFLIVGSYAFLLVAVGWAFIFDRINIYTNLSKKEVLKQYISFFDKNKISNNKYIEIITWFSRWNHKYFRLKNDNEQEVDKFITKLELILRPNDNGLCLASRHKKTFLELCTKLKKCETEEEIKEIENTANEMEKNQPEKYRIFSLGLDHNILIYLSIIVLHIVASMLISNDIKDFLGNILFYIPSDILVILVYKGIIRESEASRK